MPWVAWGTSVNHSIFFRQTVTARGECGERVRQTREERERRDKHKKSSMYNITLVSFFSAFFPSCVTDSLRFAHVRLVLSSAHQTNVK